MQVKRSLLKPAKEYYSYNKHLTNHCLIGSVNPQEKSKIAMSFIQRLHLTKLIQSTFFKNSNLSHISTDINYVSKLTVWLIRLLFMLQI